MESPMTSYKSGIPRRKFLKGSLTLLAAAGTGTSIISPHSINAQTPSSGTDTEPSPLITRKLGRTGIELPVVSLGAGAITDPGFILASFESGMRLFDTDARYRQGRHEELLGRAFRKGGIRDKVCIMTKVHTPEQRRGLSFEQSKQLLHRTFEGCLRRLRTSYVDILLVQDVSDARSVQDPAAMEAMMEIKKKGAARHLGIATHSRMSTAINAAVEAEIYDIILTSINFTMADDAALLSAIKNAHQKGLGVIAMKTQAGGYNFPNPATMREYSNITINSAALKWVCRNPHIATTIPGINHYEHLQMDLAIARNLDYTDDEKRFLEENEIKLGFEFCRQCRKCLATCPEDVEIPTLMRTHMYLKQYADFDRARQAFDSIPSKYSLDACTSCDICTARCTNSVNIPRKISELKLVYS